MAAGGATLGIGSMAAFETFGPKYMQYLGEGLSPEQAQRLAVWNAGGMGMLMAIPGATVLSKMGFNVGTAAPEITEGVARQFEQKGIGQIVKKFVLQHGENSAHAMALGMASGAVNNAVDQAAKSILSGKTPSWRHQPSVTQLLPLPSPPSTAAML